MLHAYIALGIFMHLAAAYAILLVCWKVFSLFDFRLLSIVSILYTGALADLQDLVGQVRARCIGCLTILPYYQPLGVELTVNKAKKKEGGGCMQGHNCLISSDYGQIN